MVLTRRSAIAAATIPAARALRRERRARTAENELLNPEPARKRTGRQRRSPSSKSDVEVTRAPPLDNDIMIDGTEPQKFTTTMPMPAQEESPGSRSESAIQPYTIDPPRKDASIEPNQPGTSIRWFGVPHDTPPPIPPAPIFKPAESLIHFESGAPLPMPETKLFEHPCTNPEVHPTMYPHGSIGSEAISAQAVGRSDAIGKAATAVMARMNGHGVAESEYASILGGMLSDPDMRRKLPPALIERYDSAVKGAPTSLFNGGLIDKFIHATKHATDVTARILINSKKAKRERKARGARQRQTYCQASVSPGPIDPAESPDRMMSGDSKPFGGWTFGRANDCSESVNPHLEPLSSRRLSDVPLPGVFAHPLTEANLHRRDNGDAGKGKAKEIHVDHWEEERAGVMRTAKGTFRPGPYPRRVSVGSRGGQARNAHKIQDSRDESGYSVYSASTGLNQQTDANRLTNYIMGAVISMLEPNSGREERARKVEALIEETTRTKGQKEADDIRIGFQEAHFYEMLKHTNVDLLTNALLEHMAETPKRQTDPSLPASSFPAQPRPSNPLGSPPPRQVCEHPELGPGIMSYVRVFEPLGTNHQQLPNRKIMLDSPAGEHLAP